MIEAILGIVNGGLKAWNDFWKRQERQQDRKVGAMEQREKNHEDADKALAGDRVRNSSDALQQRVQSDHQIEAGDKP